MRAALLAILLTAVPAASADAATFAVGSTGTGADAAPGDGLCRTAASTCTLRAAVMEAAADPATSDRITLPAGTYAVPVRLETAGSVELAGAGAATTTLDGDGASLLLVGGGTATIRGVALVDGSGGQAGGAIRVHAPGRLVLEDADVRENEAFTGGGGVYVEPGAEAVVRRTSITGNEATGAFGGGIWNQGTLDVEDSLVAGNRSNRSGGIRNDGEMRLRNVTVSGNEALSPDAGVGGISQNGFAFLSNATVTLNLGRGDIAGSFRGGGIQTSAGEITVVKNSIIAGNDGRGGPADCAGPVSADSRYDLLGAATAACELPASTATWQIGVAPRLGPLASNGGPTRTHLPQPDSPAVDAGFPYAPGGPAADACEARDQRGVVRLACDMGAVEREVPVPTTIVVTSTSDAVDAVPGNGTCAAAGGSCTLRAAVQEANRLPGPQTIALPAGVYIMAIAPGVEAGVNADATGDLDVVDDVAIEGAGAGTTRIDGNALSRILDVGPGSALTLVGVTLGNGRDAGGGALRLTSAEAALQAVALRGNVSTSGGGGAIATGGLDERLEVISSTLADNRAEAFGGSGGAIRAGGAVIVRDTALTGNRATGSGGAIDVAVGSLELTRSTVSGNRAEGALANGGGISASSLVAVDSTVSGNTSAAHGGGVYAANGTVENATISGNTAGTQGGGASTSGHLDLRHVTLAGNAASGGGADLLRFGGGSALTLADVIVGSTGGAGCAGLAPTSAGGNLARDASCALAGPGDRQGADPRLGPLAANGGPTKTHLLLSGSPAIGNGRSVTPASDQRGAARPLGAAPDSGAVEGTASFGAGAPAALVIGADAEQLGSDATIAATLRALGIDARPVADDATAGASLTNVRAILVSASVDPDRVASRIVRARVPVVTWEPGLVRRLGVLKAGTRARLVSGRALRVTKAGRTALSAPARVQLTATNGQLMRIVPRPSGRVLARVDRKGRPAAIVAYLRGAGLAGGLHAPARRLVLPASPGAATTAAGRRLMEGVLRWAVR